MKTIFIGIGLIFIAVCIFVHQIIQYGIVWEWSDLSHEGWFLMFLFAGVVLIFFRKG